MRSVPVLFVVASVLALPLVPAQAPETFPVLGVAYAWAPAVARVPVGTPVEWIGALFGHTITTANSLEDAARGTPNDADNSDGDPNTFNAHLPRDLPLTHRFSNAFTKSGIYPYFCALHVSAGMVGLVVVTNTTA